MALGVSISAANDLLRAGWPYPEDGALPSLPSQEKDSTEQATVAKLQDRERVLLQEEAAQLAAGGSYLDGVPILSYETGPDGRRYVVAVKVPFDTAPAGTPEATLRKAQAVRRAASAGGDPSTQDPATVAAATMLELEARGQLVRQQATAQQALAESKLKDQSSDDSTAEAASQLEQASNGTVEEAAVSQTEAASESATTTEEEETQTASTASETETSEKKATETATAATQVTKATAMGNYVVDLAVSFSERQAAYAYQVATYDVLNGKLQVLA